MPRLIRSSLDPSSAFNEVSAMQMIEISSAADLDRLDADTLRLYCHNEAKYLLVTKELVEYLRTFIGDQSALEIGAGCGDLGRALGIKMVDNKCQLWPDVNRYYQAIGQPVVKYGHDVQERDANSAVKAWQPDVVIGAWVTQWVDPNLPLPEGGGSIYGIKEIEILKYCRWYVMIGAEAIHKHKPIMALPHETVDATFVRSRRTDNRIWIWRGDKP